MSDYQIGEFVTARSTQLMFLIVGHFAKKGIDCTWDVTDIHQSHREWLLGFNYKIKNRTTCFFLSVRGHIARLKSSSPSSIARYIEDDDRSLSTKISDHGDIIAYEPGSVDYNIIDTVLEICNSAALPH
jgi:hypothetical protein